MAAGKGKKRISVVRRIAPDPMPPEQWEAAERLMATLVARAFAADHPELFGPRLPELLHKHGSEPLPTARAEVASPTTSGGGSEQQSEIGDDDTEKKPTRQE